MKHKQAECECEGCSHLWEHSWHFPRLAGHAVHIHDLSTFSLPHLQGILWCALRNFHVLSASTPTPLHVQVMRSPLLPNVEESTMATFKSTVWGPTCDSADWYVCGCGNISHFKEGGREHAVGCGLFKGAVRH